MSELINSSNERIEALNEYVKAIIEKKDIYNTYLKYQEVFSYITPFDVFSIFYFLDESKMSISVIKFIAGKLINTFRSGLKNYQWEKEKTSELMKNLFQEADLIKEKFHKLKPLLKAKNILENKEILIKAFLEFDELQKRFHKMEYIIFSNIEDKVKNPRPLTVMWTLYDDAILLQKQIISLLNTDKVEEINEAIGRYFFLVLGIIEKEELLVLPIASRLIDYENWVKIQIEAEEYGYAFMKVPKTQTTVDIEENKNSKLLFSTSNGGLSFDEMLLVFNKIGLDITFVDENNKVKFFNNPSHRIFPRSASIIGRDVKNCHPPQSVHVVEEIIDHFRKGLKNEAKFWINFNDRFIVITYYALRDEKNNYKGVLEVTQDVTEIRRLEGEQRLLQWNK